MNHREAAAFGGSVTAAAMVTAGFGWESVLPGWAMGAAILLLPRGNPRRGRLGSGISLLLCGAAMAAVLLGADAAFPERSTFPLVSVGLLIVLGRAMCGRRQSMGDTANILGILLLAVLGGILLFSVAEIDWNENLPEPVNGTKVWVTAATTAPWWGLRESKTDRTWCWYAGAGTVSLGMSLLTHGVLGRGLAGWTDDPLYRAVQAIRVLGVLQRQEALLAASVLLGAAGLLLILGELAAENLDELAPKLGKQQKNVGFLSTVFFLEWGIRSITLGTRNWIETVFWGAFPLCALWIVDMGKHEKSA